MYASSTHAGLVHDIMDVVRQNGSAHGCVFVTFKQQFLTKYTVNQLKNGRVYFYFFNYFFFYPILTDRACDTSVLGIPFNNEGSQQKCALFIHVFTFAS